jgi:hypothetical protein
MSLWNDWEDVVDTSEEQRDLRQTIGCQMIVWSILVFAIILSAVIWILRQKNFLPRL